MAQTAQMGRRVAVVSAVVVGLAGLVVGVLPSAAAPGAPAAPRATASTDWPMYHGNPDRTGRDSHMPAFRGGLHVVRRLNLDGAVYASPIVAHGLTIVATENDTVYAFGPRYGLRWKRHLGSPVPQSSLPCGNIFPLGITGTPIYSAGTNLVYVAAELANPLRHRLFALHLGTGRAAFGHPLDFPGVDRSAMQQRGALALTGGRVWVPFGGLDGDCGQYKGRVVGWRSGGRGSAVSYTVPTAREAGIWATPGPVVTPSGSMLVSVGNGASGPGDPYDHSDSVLKLGAGAHLLDSFSPSTWASDNAADADLGSQGPAIVDGKWVFAAGKSGNAYTLQLSHLGGIGHPVSRTSLCTSFGGTATVGSVVYVPCTDGVRAVQIGLHGGMHVLWHASSSITGSPVVGAGLVWVLDPGSGVLHALGVRHGGDRASVPVGSVTRFATPALSGRRILVGTTSGLTVVGY